MLIRAEELEGIRAGSIDLAFRRWERPRVVVGTRLRTALGVVEVTSVEQVTERSLDADQARRAGAASLAALRRALEHKGERPLYRIGLRHGGADPRTVLREQVPDAAEITGILTSLDRLDRVSPTGPWTRTTLALIDERPGVRAPDLAAHLGRDTPSFKRDVRKLKERGLTESLDVGYRLSRRGAAVLDHGGPPRERAEPEPGTPLPRIGAAASRALTARGLTRLEHLTELSAVELAALPGVGPIALRALGTALADVGLALRAEAAEQESTDRLA